MLFARGLGIGGILAGIITGTLLVLSSAGRAWRVLSAVGLLIGVSTLIAAWKGMCVVSGFCSVYDDEHDLEGGEGVS